MTLEKINLVSAITKKRMVDSKIVMTMVIGSVISTAFLQQSNIFKRLKLNSLIDAEPL